MGALPGVCNAWGLCGMHGNVEGWVWGWRVNGYGGLAGEGGGPVVDPLGGQGAGRVVRGGYWGFARSCRAAVRGYVDPGNRINFVGLRPSRSMP